MYYRDTIKTKRMNLQRRKVEMIQKTINVIDLANYIEKEVQDIMIYDAEISLCHLDEKYGRLVSLENLIKEFNLDPLSELCKKAIEKIEHECTKKGRVTSSPLYNC